MMEGTLGNSAGKANNFWIISMPRRYSIPDRAAPTFQHMLTALWRADSLLSSVPLRRYEVIRHMTPE